MVAVVFEQPDGSSTTLNVEDGDSVMRAAVFAGIEGIDADCGGELSCATCHVGIPEEWREKLKPASEDEKAMLEFAVGADENSRLSCQIFVDASLEGLRVIVPTSQR